MVPQLLRLAKHDAALKKTFNALVCFGVQEHIHMQNAPPTVLSGTVAAADILLLNNI